jgi:hypothetical protein
MPNSVLEKKLIGQMSLEYMEHQGFSQRWKAVYSVACAKWSVLTVQFELRKNQYKIKLNIL